MLSDMRQMTRRRRAVSTAMVAGYVIVFCAATAAGIWLLAFAWTGHLP